MWLGEFSAADVIDLKFTTRGTTGAPTTLAGTPAISVYKSNSTTESTAGVTLTADFDSRPGLNHVHITTATDATFYADANDFQIVITTGTVGGTSVVGEVVGHFTLRNRASLKPTTAGRTLDVSAGGEAGVDWANVGSPTTANNLSATTVGTVAALGTGAIGSASYQTDSITSAALSNGARDEIAGQVWEEARSGHTTAGSFGQGVASVQGNVTGSAASVTGAVGSVTGNVGGNVVGSVASVTAGVTVTTNNDKTGYSIGTNGIVAGSYQTDAITSGALSTGAAQEIAGQVWDVVLSGHLTAGTTGNALNAAGSAGDPWSTALPGAYGAGTAGKIIGDNVNATISSRSSHTAADVWAAATRTLTAQTDTSGTTTLLSRLTAGRATNLDFLDVAVSSRLATAGYTAPPSAATVAAAIIATTLSELTAGTPPTTPTVGQSLMMNYHQLVWGGTFNKDTGVSTFRNAAGAVIYKRVDSDDGTTFSEGGLTAGP